MNYLVLIEDQHYTDITINICNKLNIDVVIFCSKRKTIAQPNNINFVYGLHNIVDSISTKNVYILDYHPLAIQLLLTYTKLYNVIYIQHGYYESKIDRKLSKRSLYWFYNAFYFAVNYLFKFNEFDFFKRLYFCFKYFMFGNKSCITEISKNKKINLVFLIDETSKAKFKKDFKGNFNEIYITGALDDNKFIYSKTGFVIYISQPLHQTGHVTKEQYLNFLSDLYKNQGQMHFIVHPKMENSFIQRISEIGFIPSTKNDLNEIHVSKIIGHFSSLLIGVPKNIPLEIISEISQVRMDEALSFNPYSTYERDGLNKIKKIINENFNSNSMF